MDTITVLLDDGFSVEQVAEKTGVSVEVIKAWLEALDARCGWDDWSGRQ
jgi:transposase